MGWVKCLAQHACAVVLAMTCTPHLGNLAQAHGTGPLVTRTMWRQSMGAIDRGECRVLGWPCFWTNGI
mgnify:CR=1 FL=1